MGEPFGGAEVTPGSEEEGCVVQGGAAVVSIGGEIGGVTHCRFPS